MKTVHQIKIVLEIKQHKPSQVQSLHRLPVHKGVSNKIKSATL